MRAPLHVRAAWSEDVVCGGCRGQSQPIGQPTRAQPLLWQIAQDLEFQKLRKEGLQALAYPPKQGGQQELGGNAGQDRLEKEPNQLRKWHVESVTIAARAAKAKPLRWSAGTAMKTTICSRACRSRASRSRRNVRGKSSSAAKVHAGCDSPAPQAHALAPATRSSRDSLARAPAPPIPWAGLPASCSRSLAKSRLRGWRPVRTSNARRWHGTSR